MINRSQVLNSLQKLDKMLCKSCILSRFPNLLHKLNNTQALMLDSHFVLIVISTINKRMIDY